MSVLPVRIYGDPVLKRAATPIERFDQELRRIVADLNETMHAYNGVGLAANQIGLARRVAVVDVPIDNEHRVRATLVNPVIFERQGSEVSEEGCLSIPGIYEDVSRAYAIAVRAHDEHGQEYDLRADGYLARAIQHEIDHLDGVLFIDRLSPLRRQFLRRALEALARGEVPEGYHPSAERGGAS